MHTCKTHTNWTAHAFDSRFKSCLCRNTHTMVMIILTWYGLCCMKRIFFLLWNNIVKIWYVQGWKHWELYLSYKNSRFYIFNIAKKEINQLPKYLNNIIQIPLKVNPAVKSYPELDTEYPKEVSDNVAYSSAWSCSYYLTKHFLRLNLSLQISSLDNTTASACGLLFFIVC